MQLLVHAGAGNIGPDSDLAEIEGDVRRALATAVAAGRDVLRGDGSALDAVVAAVIVLEDCPLFNAGRGSVLNRDGAVEMDAAVMDGATAEAGALAGVRTIRNPVAGARALLDSGDAVLLAGDAADRFAGSRGCRAEPSDYFVTDYWRTRWHAVRDSRQTVLDHSARAIPDKHGTVGAVARDCRGRLAAATSTGGLLNKLPGRISDSALPGAGTFADDRLAVSFTGTGEAIIRAAAGARLAADIAAGQALAPSCDAVLRRIAALGGEAGLIALDHNGERMLAANTSHLLRAWLDDDGSIETALQMTER